MDNVVRVLHVISGIGSGGAEMFLMNMYRHMDHEKIVFDLLLQSSQNLYREELESYGSKEYQIPPYFKHPIQNHAALKKVLDNGYPIIHVHANALLYMAPILLAKRADIPCRIVHSHNTSLYYKWALPYHVINKRRVTKYATHHFACSDDAGAWMFGSDYTVIPNAVDLDGFSFRPESRAKHRQELGISAGDLVIGQIGRLDKVKNQSFTLDVFKQIVARRNDSHLVFIGGGSDRDALRDKARMLGVEDRVHFLGVRTDVSDLINAFDILMFPSLYEGLPLVMIEAQANGLAIVCSPAIPEECVFAENIKHLSLDLGTTAWADAILTTDVRRVDCRKKLTEAGFDIRVEAKKLQDFYLNVAREIK